MTRIFLAAGRDDRLRPDVLCARPILESLEPRLLFATFLVTTTADDGPGSLRQAILDANATSSIDFISFAVRGAGVHTIAPLTPLPPTTSGAIIDGTTQPGYHGTPLIELDGEHAGPTADGLTIGSPQTTISGLAINRFGGNGISVLGALAVIRADFIGTDPTGTVAEGNGGDGIYVRSNAVIVGGLSTGDRNLISGNGMSGIELAGQGGRVWNNFIGTNAAGDAALGNRLEGVDVNELTGTTTVSLGVTTASGSSPLGAGNVISGNGSSGVLGSGAPGLQLFIGGNRIGTDAAGNAPVPNGSSPDAPYHDGITSMDVTLSVGGNTPQTRNVISGNRGNGINIISGGGRVIGNYVGTNAVGNAPVGNAQNGVVSGAPLQLGDSGIGQANVISGNGHDGALILGDASNSKIIGNLIGTDASGTSALGNAANGIELVDVGGITIGSRSIDNLPPTGSNVVSGNGGDGILIRPTTKQSKFLNSVQANLIGTDRTGMARLGNALNGIEILGSRNMIGGPVYAGTGALGARNIISANGGSGIRVGDSALPTAANNTIQGTYVGLDAAGDYKPDLGNDGDGITLVNAAQTLIGSSLPYVYGNSIAWNGGNGVTVTGGDAAVGNQISSNTIYFNDKLGIDLANDGVTPNDPQDADTGPNQLQNYPVITTAHVVFGQVDITYTLSGRPNTTYRVDVYAGVRADPSGFGEGQQYVGSDTVQTGPDGMVNRMTVIRTKGTVDGILTATATDPAGNTSEFSKAFASQPLPPLIVTAATFDPNGGAPLIRVTFSHDGTVDPNEASLDLTNQQTGARLSLKPHYNPATRTATYGVPAGRLGSGSYDASLSNDTIRDVWGQDLNMGGGYHFTFTISPGDANVDGKVSFADLLIVSRSYGDVGPLLQGDFDHDGRIGFGDVLLLAQHSTGP